ncbi:acetylglutamate kinase, partial [Streptomyces niveus]
EVNPGMVRTLLERGHIPVVSPVARGADGQVYNVNADLAASALAVALDAARLVILTDVAGLYANWPHSTEVIGHLTADALDGLLPGLASGMLPKMEGCLSAVRGGVHRARVLDGRVPHAVLRGVLDEVGPGTTVTASA